MSKRVLEGRILREMQFCRHFTGTQHSTCAAGVHYRNLVGGDAFGWGRRLPCIADDYPTKVACASAVYPTREEAARQIETTDAETNAYIKQVFTDRLCPSCGKRWDGEEVPPCMYCEHCGTRLYQGALPEEAQP